MANPKHPFGLGKDQRRKEKKGGAAALPGAAAGSTPAGLSFDSGVQAISTIARAAPGGGTQAGLWEAVVSGLSKATGLGAVAAGKTLVVGLVVAASSLAAGVSLYIGNSTPASAPSLGRRVFVDSATEEEPVKLARVSAPAETQTQSGSLEYLAEGNSPAPEAAAAPERTADAPAAAPEAKAAEVPNHDAPAPATAQVHDPGPKQLLAKRAMPSARGEPGGGARLEPVKSLNGKMGAGFQDVYRPQKTGAFDATSQAKSGYGVNRRSVLAKSGGNALAQAKFANRMSRSGTRMASGTAASHTTSLPFDGANTAAALGATKAGGASLGGTGASSSANGVLDSKSVEPPPAPESKKNENKTPYQGLIMAAIAALMIGTVLLMIAGKMSGEAKKSPGPDAAAKLQAAKMLAMAAMAAGGAAAAMGGVLAGQYGQMTQGMPFIMGGGILAVQAGMVLMKDDKAGQDGQEGVTNAAGQAASQAGQALSGMNNQGSDTGSSKPSTQSTPVNRTNAKPNITKYGDVP